VEEFDKMPGTVEVPGILFIGDACTTSKLFGEPEYSVACGLSFSMEGITCDGFTLFARPGALPRAVGFEPFRLSTYFAICLTTFFLM
jgi:hypothetical protein